MTHALLPLSLPSPHPLVPIVGAQVAASWWGGQLSGDSEMPPFLSLPPLPTC